MSVYNKLKLICEKPQKESMTYRFKKRNFLAFLESKSWRNDPAFCEALSYFDAVCFKYKGYPSSFIINKIKNNSHYKHDRIFKTTINSFLYDLLKNDHDHFLIDDKGFLKYKGPDRSKLKSTKYKRIDDGINYWRYTYANNIIIDRKCGEYFFVEYIKYFYIDYRKQLQQGTRSLETKLTIKQLKFYGFYQEPEY